jgi:sphingomyelin phosphodiesterase
VNDAAAELTPAFWHNITTVFATNDSAFREYWARMSRGFGVSSCTGTCQTQAICGLRAADAQFNCVTPTPGFNFAKWDGTDAAHVKSQGRNAMMQA